MLNSPCEDRNFKIVCRAQSGENTADLTSLYILIAFAGQLPATRNVALLPETSPEIQAGHSCPTAMRSVRLPSYSLILLLTGAAGLIPTAIGVILRKIDEHAVEARSGQSP